MKHDHQLLPYSPRPGWVLERQSGREGEREIAEQESPSSLLLSGTAGRMSELEKAFRQFAMYGDTAATGNEMTGKNFSKMLKETGVMDGKFVTSTDVDIVFNKVK